MKLYHRTYRAREILIEGFRDATDYYLTTSLHTGVWFSDRPLDINEGADGDTLLTVDIPEGALADYEWVEDGKLYREFLIPASLANQYGPPTIVQCDDDESIQVKQDEPPEIIELTKEMIDAAYERVPKIAERRRKRRERGE